MIFKFKPKILIFFSIFLATSSISFSQDYVEDLDLTVEFLADLNSRITGYPGSEKAAEFIEDKLIDFIDGCIVDIGPSCKKDVATKGLLLEVKTSSIWGGWFCYLG